MSHNPIYHVRDPQTGHITIMVKVSRSTEVIEQPLDEDDQKLLHHNLVTLKKPTTDVFEILKSQLKRKNDDRGGELKTLRLRKNHLNVRAVDEYMEKLSKGELDGREGAQQGYYQPQMQSAYGGQQLHGPSGYATPFQPQSGYGYQAQRQSA